MLSKQKPVKYQMYRNPKTKWERAAVKVNLWLFLSGMCNISVEDAECSGKPKEQPNTLEEKRKQANSE